jgi:hypothetical protein
MQQVAKAFGCCGFKGPGGIYEIDKPGINRGFLPKPIRQLA